MNETLGKEEYDALLIRMATRMRDQRPEWTLDTCIGMLRSGIRFGVSQSEAKTFEDAFNRAFDELEREQAATP